MENSVLVKCVIFPGAFSGEKLVTLSNAVQFVISNSFLYYYGTGEPIDFTSKEMPFPFRGLVRGNLISSKSAQFIVNFKISPNETINVPVNHSDILIKSEIPDSFKIDTNKILKEIRYEVPESKIDFSIPTIFLAGPTVRGHQQHLTSWRFEAVKLFKEKGFSGQLIIPEFTDLTQSDKYRYDLPLWEFTGLTKSHVNMFWIPRTKEIIGLTTNHEFGYWLAKDRNKVIYGRPDDAYRMKYLDIMWVEDAKRKDFSDNGSPIDVDIYETLEKTVDASIKLCFKLVKRI